MLKKYLIQIISFTRKEKNGILVIITFVMLLLLGYRYFYLGNFKEDTKPAADYKNVMDSLVVLKTEGRKNYYNNYDSNDVAYYPSANRNFKQPVGELFYFDPNTLPVDGWMKLGVKEKIANNIQKYISKGGKFRQAEDIKKIWGLRPDFVEKIIRYVRIKQEESSTTLQQYPAYEKKVYEKKVIQPVSINEADSTAYIDLPGIGPSFARRIINFRNRLGGFYSIDQVAETFGLPDSTFQKIKPYLKLSDEPVKKININTASMEELKAHPYIRWQLANLIIQYKTQHGPYKKIDDIKKIMVVDDNTFNKVAPYLAVE
jgi:competence protein ComEA